MAEDPLANWHPRGVDLSTPSTARMYDHFLGGKDNYQVDREAAARVLERVPQVAVAVSKLQPERRVLKRLKQPPKLLTAEQTRHCCSSAAQSAVSMVKRACGSIR